jgi:hypothetical protein
VAMLDYPGPEEALMDAVESDDLFSKICGDIQESEPRKSLSPLFRPSQLFIAAAVMGLIITTCSTVWLGLRNRDLRDEMAFLMDKHQELIQGNQRLGGHFAHIQQPFSLMRTVVTKRVELKAVPGSKITSLDNYMLVYWNPLSEKLLLAGANLPSLTRDQQYQLWALTQGKPVDAGVFDTNGGQDANFGFQKDIPQAQAFEVTIEPRGGSKSPTLGNLCLLAKL